MHLEIAYWQNKVPSPPSGTMNHFFLDETMKGLRVFQWISINLCPNLAELEVMRKRVQERKK